MYIRLPRLVAFCVFPVSPKTNAAHKKKVLNPNGKNSTVTGSSSACFMCWFDNLCIEKRIKGKSKKRRIGFNHTSGRVFWRSFSFHIDFFGWNVNW